MLSNPQTRKRLIIGYVVFLIFGFFYVRAVLKNGNIELKEKGAKGKVEEVHPANVTLVVESYGQSINYQVKMKSSDSFFDLLENLRNNEQITYERTAYISGIELSEINGIKADETHHWKVFVDGIDKTSELGKFHLQDEKAYFLRLEK